MELCRPWNRAPARKREERRRACSALEQGTRTQARRAKARVLGIGAGHPHASEKSEGARARHWSRAPARDARTYLTGRRWRGDGEPHSWQVPVLIQRFVRDRRLRGMICTGIPCGCPAPMPTSFHLGRALLQARHLAPYMISHFVYGRRWPAPCQPARSTPGLCPRDPTPYNTIRTFVVPCPAGMRSRRTRPPTHMLTS